MVEERQLSRWQNCGGWADQCREEIVGGRKMDEWISERIRDFTGNCTIATSFDARFHRMNENACALIFANILHCRKPATERKHIWGVFYTEYSYILATVRLWESREKQEWISLTSVKLYGNCLRERSKRAKHALSNGERKRGGKVQNQANSEKAWTCFHSNECAPQNLIRARVQLSLSSHTQMF